MCTLTYLPVKSGFLFTSNRDEIISREPAVFPVIEQQSERKLLMPLDTQGGGTWILCADNGDAACLLNGAFENHRRNPPYRKSRGRVIVESFAYIGVDAFLGHYDFVQIEPFTLVRIEQTKLKNIIHEIRWDGKQLHHNTKDATQPHIWSSVTLYDSKMRQKRQQWFDAWLHTDQDFTVDNIRDFHLNGGEGDPSVDFRMTRSGGLQTISLTCIQVTPTESLVDYQNLKDQQRASAQIEMDSNREMR